MTIFKIGDLIQYVPHDKMYPPDSTSRPLYQVTSVTDTGDIIRFTGIIAGKPITNTSYINQSPAYPHHWRHASATKTKQEQLIDRVHYLELKFKTRKEANAMLSV